MSPAGKAVFVRDGRQWSRVAVSEVLYLEADDNSTTVYTASRTFTVPRMLKEVLDTVADERIQRIHRCHAVNLDRVLAVSDNGLHVGDKWLPIGRSFRSEVLKLLRMI
ncbi:MAG: LytTR family transcriptional regulator [Flavobacteriales bacterium]|nr:MAG: LytTR family transcriptional regulator [Flavobacteriales bacterium]